MLIHLAGSVTFGLFQPSLVLFPNGGFEIDPLNSSNGWAWPSSDWIWDGGLAHSGTHSARVYRSSGSATASVWSAHISVQPSTMYTLTYWLRTQDATYWPSVSLYQYTSDQTQTGPRLIAHANINSGTTAWYLVSYRLQTMPNASTIRVRIYLPIATGTFWFDDFGLEHGAPAVYAYQLGFPVVASGSVFYSSPVVADINSDGANELLVGGGSAANGWSRTGALLTGFPIETGDLHIQSQLALADLDGDHDLEIVAGTKAAVASGQGRVFIWHHTGAQLVGWPKSVAWNTQYATNVSSVGTIALADIEGDQSLEVLAGSTNNVASYVGPVPPPSPNLYAWHANGSLVAGQWPTWHNRAGIYGQIAAGDLSGNGAADVEVGRDHHFLNTYTADGNSMPGWPIETYLAGNSGRYDADEHIDYGNAAPIIADLEGDGVNELIVAGFVAGPGSATFHNSAVLVLEPDGTRRAGWETPALGTGILNLYDMSIQLPVVADLDQDGRLEIVATTNDGWIRSYRSDKTILWAFNYTQGAVLVATEPVIGDIDGDGSLEVLFGTRVPSQQAGIYYSGPVGLWALESDGAVTPGFPLPIPTPGMFGAPTLADLDGDGELEILAASREGQVVVWDTGTSYNPLRMPWPTGRHDVHRSATYTSLAPLEASHKALTSHLANQGDTLTYCLHIVSSAPVDGAIFLTDTIPAGIAYISGTLSATSGDATQTAGTIHWSGNMPGSSEVRINYAVSVTTAAPQVIRNTAVINTGSTGLLTRTADLFVNFALVYLPALTR